MSLAKMPYRNYFVAPGGDDRNPAPIERPFATLYKAPVGPPGRTVNLRAGTYQAMVSWNKSGTPGAPITIRSYHNEDVTVAIFRAIHAGRRDDPAFGDCWKAVIPYRPIRYPGVQHAIWEDAVNAARNPASASRQSSRAAIPCAAMHAATDFAHPQAAAGRPLTDKSGKLKYDITWYDREYQNALVKPGPSARHQPDRQLYVISTSCGQFSVAGSYVQIQRAEVRICPISTNKTTRRLRHQQLRDQACRGGICGGGRRCRYTSLFIDKVGDWLIWRNGGYDGAISHCFYFNGTRCVVANCFFGRSNKGGPIQNYPDGVTENLFDSNMLYHSDGGSIFMGTGRNYITNNISLQTGQGMGPVYQHAGIHLRGQLQRGGSIRWISAAQEANGNYSETFEKFASPATCSTTRAAASTIAATWWMPGNVESTTTSISAVGIGVWD